MQTTSDLAVSVGVALLAFSCSVVLLVVLILCLRKRLKTSGFSSLRVSSWKKDTPSSYDHGSQARSFQLMDVKFATDNFSVKLGEGGFGSVFHGKLFDGSEVAVKVQAYNSNQGAQEFFNEVQLLSRAHHRNVVSLVGYCEEANSRILIYEYLSGGTLEEHLHDFKSKALQTWKSRLRIALDTAKGIEYLHYGCNPPIIHRDLKSGNILLTSKLQAKVADFGLSRLVEIERSRVITTVKGTSGYVDPEYYQTQELTQKSDVYSFGVVLLEIICGREALMDQPPRKQIKLCDWARDFLLERRIKRVIDPLLSPGFNMESVWRAAELAMFCVEPRAVHRPTMADVVQELKHALRIEEGQHQIPVASLVCSSAEPVQPARKTRSEPAYFKPENK